MSTLRISLLFILSIFLITSLSAQSIDAKLGGNSDTEKFNVINSDDDTLFTVQGDGGILFLGDFGTGTIPTEGVGTRMMWYPKKAAFRAGRIINTFWDSTVWDDENIGEHSVAMGYNTKASAASSTAFGVLTQATGYRSFATGLMTIASGEQSTAMGWETEANGDNSIAGGRETNTVGSNTFAMGYKTQAYGEGSVAMGNDTRATGEGSTAMGKETSAEGDYSIAMGEMTRAKEDMSTAMGTQTYAAGINSVAMGLGTSAQSFAEVAIGRYNTVPGGNPDAWDESDRVFVIGNGTTVFGLSDALVVLKNGNVGIGTSTPLSKLSVGGDGSNSTIYGETTSFTGVYGVATGNNGTGVSGFASYSTDGANYGGNFVSNGPNGVGVKAEARGSSGWGVYALAIGASGKGVVGNGQAYDFDAVGPGVDYGSTSSIRWKRNIIEIDNPLGKIAKLRGVYFDWDEEHGGQHAVGMIAEEVGKVLPEIVVYEENGIDADGMDYSKLTPLLVEAVKALLVRVEELEQKID